MLSATYQHIIVSGHAYLECLRKAHATAGRGGLQEGKATRDPFRTLVECFASRSGRLITTRYGDGSDRLRNGAGRLEFSNVLGLKKRVDAKTSRGCWLRCQSLV